MNSVQALDDTLVAGKYFMPKGQICVVSFNQLHRDPKVWGDDVSDFDWRKRTCY